MSVNELVEDFCRSLKRRHIEGSLATGKRTAELLRILITSQRHADAQSLLDDVRRELDTLRGDGAREVGVGKVSHVDIH